MLVKICGITRLDDAEAAVEAGAGAIGFVFWPESPRVIDPYRARAIVSMLPPKESVKSFRVFVRRSDQKFAIPSPDLARDLGSRVWTARGWKVDLDHADLVIRVEILPGASHPCYLDQPARFQALLLEFLAPIRAAAAGR